MDFIRDELRRRREGDVPSALTTTRQEADEVEWLSGIYLGRTLGTSIAFMVCNRDCQSEDYRRLEDFCRPGHADYTYQEKYHHRDPRGGGRASGRETVARVIAGAIAKQLLGKRMSFSTSICGNKVSCTISGLPAGVGEPIFDRLNARLGFAMLSIPSAMSFSVGDPDGSWQLPREDFPDQWREFGYGDKVTLTNHCGGIQGGISNGMPVVFHVGFHLPVTQLGGMVCRGRGGELHAVEVRGRHDRVHITRLPVVVEAMAALTVADLVRLS